MSKISSWFFKFIKIIKNHKIISSIVVILLVGGGYWYFATRGQVIAVSYVTAKAEKGTITTFISGSGQVSASDQVDIKSKISQNVVYVGVKEGQSVRAGTLIMQLDTTDLEKSVRDAQYNLDNANLNYQKLVGDPSLSTPKNQQQAKDNLTKAYNDGFGTVTNAFLDMPSIMTGLNNILFGNDLNKAAQNINYYTDYTKTLDDKVFIYRDTAHSSYDKAYADYNQNFNDYKSASLSSDQATIEKLINETYNTALEISDAVKNANNLIQFYEDKVTAQAQGQKPNPIADTQLATLNTYTGKIGTHLNNLLSIQSTIKSNTDAVTGASLDVKGQQISLQQAKNALADAKSNLANAYVYAPFDGVVATLYFNKGASVSSGATVATMITNQSITEIPFNEINITKIKVGQKVNLTFDAIDSLNIVGNVAEISTLGTVTQGVVNYTVKIVFDASGTQVKPGMSVSADVITAVKQDVLIVPNSAVKTQGNLSYVQILVDGKPVQKIIQAGLANDTDTEIVSGLSGGEDVITQTITSANTKTATQTTSGSTVRIPGLTGGGGGLGGGSFRGN